MGAIDSLTRFFDNLKGAQNTYHQSQDNNASEYGNGIDPLAQYNSNIDKSVGDISDMNDIDFTKDFDWSDENGNTHRWRIGYKNSLDKNGNPIKGYGGEIVAVFDRDNPVDPIYGRENLRSLFRNYFGMDKGAYTVNDLGFATGDYNGRYNYGYPYNGRTYDVGRPHQWYDYDGQLHSDTAQFDPWQMFPTGYQ